MRPSLFLVPCALLTLAASAAADTLKVPADFNTIGDAAAVAADGDTISVSKGTYLESVTITAPNVKLVGKKAVIDAQFGGVGISLGGDGQSVSGFTVVNGSTGIVADHADVTITKCVVATCSDDGISIGSGPATITGNTSRDNGGDGIDYTQSFVGRAVIDKNVCIRNGSNGIIVSGADFEVTRNRCEANETDGIDATVELLMLEGGPDPVPLVIEQNDCLGNEDNGLDVLNEAGWPMDVHGNDCSRNADDGLQIDASNADIQGNRCEENVDEGMDMRLHSSVVSGNTANGNQGQGILISGTPPIADGGGTPTGNDNEITKNTSNDNTGDGIRLDFGSGNTFKGNKCSGNGDDGMDINNAECQDNTLEGNTFSNNGHEGLDNGGSATDVIKNTCKGNGYGEGPDIAGTGDNGLGSVDSFQDNKFETGNETTPSRMDNYELTGP